jgi:DNA repair photolyase
MPFDWSINPYRGCQHGCSFCYARSTHEFLGEDTDDTFQRHIFMKDHAPDILRSQLEKRLRSGKLKSAIPYVAIGTATDPYQQIEGRAKLTRGCLEVLAEFGVPAAITTRSPLILRDMDVLLRLPSVTVNMSIGTLNRTVWRQFEPSSPSPAQRLSTVEQLSAEGIPTSVFIAPILPYITDGHDELRQLIAAISKAGASSVMRSYLRLSTSPVKFWFFQCLEQHYPHLTSSYAKLFEGSSSVPTAYREPVMRLIDELVAGHELRTRRTAPERQSFGAAAASAVHECSEAPVQLTLF